MSCSSRHPELGLACDNPSDNHRYCSAFDAALMNHRHWTNLGYEPPKVESKPSKQRETAEEIVRRTSPKGHSMRDIRRAAKKGSEQAENRWTDEEKALLRESIKQLAEYQESFTTDDLWQLCPHVKPGPGIGALLNRCVAEGVIKPGGEATSERAREDHDQGRRLRIWESLIYP